MYVRAEFISLRSIPPGCDLQRQSTETAACDKKEKKKNWFHGISGECAREMNRDGQLYRVRVRVRERECKSESMCESSSLSGVSQVHFLVSAPIPFLDPEFSSKSNSVFSLQSTDMFPNSLRYSF